MITITVCIPDTHTNYTLESKLSLNADASLDEAIMAFAKALVIAGYNYDHIPNALQEVAEAYKEGYEVL